jgi:hypothetical protein
MVIKEMLPTQILISSAVGIGVAAMVILLCTFSAGYTLVVVIAMCWMHCVLIGCVALSGATVGCSEAMTLSIVSGIVAHFLIAPTIEFVARSPGKSVFGKLQSSLVKFAPPLMCTVMAIMCATVCMYRCDITLLRPFAAVWVAEAAAAVLAGMLWMPGMMAVVFAGRCWMGFEPSNLQCKKITGIN